MLCGRGLRHLRRHSDSSCNGLYAKTAHVCKPVYQHSWKGGSGGLVLYQPSGDSDWQVDYSDHATICYPNGYGDFLTSGGNSGVCPYSADGPGCAGKWMSIVGGWHNNPSLTERYRASL